MPHGKAKAKPIDTTYFSLVNPADLLEALQAMVEHGYQGA